MKVKGKRISKRFALCCAAFVVVSGMGMAAIKYDMEAVAVTCATGLCGLIGYYMNQETKRPSDEQTTDMDA